MENPDLTLTDKFDIVYCYGLLYHLTTPAQAIAYLSARCRELLLLETCVSPGEEDTINLCQETAINPSHAISGMGCRPTRRWLYSHLKQHFEFVYLPITQPNHEEFPVDWTNPVNTRDPVGLIRSVFIASRQHLTNSLLVEMLPVQQQRH